MSSRVMVLVGIVLVIPLAALSSIFWVADVKFDRNCGGHLDRAAHANTVPLALSELTQALDYADAHGMTEGYTSIIYRTPDEDVGYWYTNLRGAQANLTAEHGSPLEQTNMLLKLHETLGQHPPSGIFLHPHNGQYALLGVLFFLIALIGVFMVGAALMDA